MPVEKCYPSGKNTPLMIAGYALLALGVLLLFLCIPCWGVAGAAGAGADRCGSAAFAA